MSYHIPGGWGGQKRIPRIFTPPIDRPKFGSTPITAEQLRAYTVIVAADGSGDVENVQSGMDLLPSTGGSIFIKEGDYSCEPVNLISNLMITGVGKATKLNFGVGGGLIMNSKSNILISSMWLHGGGVNEGVEADANSVNISVENCWIDNFRCGCEFGSVSAASTVNGCWIWGCNTFGLSVKYKLIITGNWIYDNQKSGLLVNAAAQCIISNNLIYNNGLGHDGVYENGIQVVGAWNVISGNRCYGNYGSDIWLDYTAQYNLVHGNNCREDFGAPGSITDLGGNNQVMDNII